MDLSKSAINKKYDQLMSQLKSGNLSRKDFKRSADRLYELYHGKANKAQRAKDAKPTTRPKQPSTTPKPTAKTKSTTKDKPKTQKPKASDKAVKGGYTVSPEKRQPGSYGALKQPTSRIKKLPYAGKFPGEPDKKEDKKKKPRNLGKGSFRNLYK